MMKKQSRYANNTEKRTDPKNKGIEGAWPQKTGKKRHWFVYEIFKRRVECVVTTSRKKKRFFHNSKKGLILSAS